jgi:hypothetical protein
MVTLLFTTGALGTLLFFACLMILFFVAEPGWLLAWLIASAVVAIVGCGLGVVVLARRGQRPGDGRSQPSRTADL